MRTWLTPSGAAAAAAVGTLVATATGWRGLALLAVFFVTSSALTRGGGRRRPAQVLANGGVATVCALLAPWTSWGGAGFAGALAAATADTWSTEIGARSRSRPRLITTLEAVANGTSGGITLQGTTGGLLGAATIALAAHLLGLTSGGAAAWVAAAGVAGTLLDSLLGASLQARWRCVTCGALVEERAHGCAGPEPTPVSGLPWLTNDAVNLVATLGGALGAALPHALGGG